jgi:hypothetical protein
MKTPQWFKKLDAWTDRQPMSALILIAVLCLVGLVLACWLDSISARQQGPIFCTGFFVGLFVGAAAHVADLKRKGP